MQSLTGQPVTLANITAAAVLLIRAGDRARPRTVRARLVAFLDAVVIVDPLQYQHRHDEPDGQCRKDAVSEAWQRAWLAEFCRDAGLDEIEEYFLQTVVRLTDISGVLSDNALGVRTASFAVPWASSLYPAYRDGPLRHYYFQAALQSARLACDNLQPGSFPFPTARSWLTRLSNILAVPITRALAPLNITSTEAQEHQREMVSFVLDTESRPSLTFEFVDNLAAEVAFGLLSRAASLDKFVWQLRILKPGMPGLRSDLARMLLRPTRIFNTLVSVGGARTLDSIEMLNPAARIRQVRVGKPGSFAGWGVAAPKAREFVEKFEFGLGRGVQPAFRTQRITLSVTVHASDTRAAATIARRTVAEVLDQYVAGHPFVQFEVDDIVGVSQADKPWVQPVSLRPPIESVVKPLAIPWPDALRQAMRVSHLLRDATAPMTRVALAWVMIEASGLLPSDINQIAKALALKRLRDSSFIPYRSLVNDSMDRERVRFYKRRSEDRLLSARRTWNMATASTIPSAVADKMHRWVVRAELLSKMYGLLQVKADEEATVKRTALAKLDKAVNPTVNAELGHYAYLPAKRPWLSVLESNWETSSNSEASALRTLMKFASIPTRVSVENLSRVVRSGATSATFLIEGQDWWVDVLNAFYSARNLNLHSGIFDSEGDTALGELAILVSDSLFEMWAAWYSKDANQGQNAGDVTRTLASRFDRITRYLREGSTLLDVDIDNITAPNWAPVEELQDS